MLPWSAVDYKCTENLPWIMDLITKSRRLWIKSKQVEGEKRRKEENGRWGGGTLFSLTWILYMAQKAVRHKQCPLMPKFILDYSRPRIIHHISQGCSWLLWWSAPEEGRWMNSWLGEIRQTNKHYIIWVSCSQNSSGEVTCRVFQNFVSWVRV